MQQFSVPLDVLIEADAVLKAVLAIPSDEVLPFSLQLRVASIKGRLGSYVGSMTPRICVAVEPQALAA